MSPKENSNIKFLELSDRLNRLENGHMLKALIFFSTLNTGCILALFWFFIFWR